jgi:hypothetical protein
MLGSLFIDFSVLERYRILLPHLPSGNSGNGAFEFGAIRVIASNGGGWDHLSVSLAHRTPTWEEMELVKRRFFKPHALVVQYHLPESKHISCHPYCLHMWRPHHHRIKLPPPNMV